MVVQSYKQLIAWQKAVDLVVAVYKLSEQFPRSELYGLSSQIRKAAVSVPSNIAEGQARLSTGEFRQFLGNARGSVVEVQTQVLISERLGFVDAMDSGPVMQSAVEVQCLINGLLKALPSRV